MKQLIHIIVTGLLCIVASATITSCDHKELCLGHRLVQRVKVEFDWSDAPEASPRGMTVYFYPLGNADGSAPTGAYQRVDFKGMDGGYVELPRGVYRIICYSNDSEINQFHSVADYDAHTVFTREGSLLECLPLSLTSTGPRAEGQADQRIVITPDQLWGSTLAWTEVIGTGEFHEHTSGAGRSASEATDPATGERIQVITLMPHEMTCHYTYEIRNVKNLKHVDKMCAAISGMTPSIKAATEELHTEPVTLPLEAISVGDKNIVTGSFHTFGHHADNPQPHIMTLYVWMDDGRKFVYGTGTNPGSFDVTEQVENAPDRRHVHLIIDGVELPQPLENGSGFHPSVDGWGTVESDIIM